MFVCIAVPFRLNHIIEAGDGNEQVGMKLSDYLSSHLMLGREGLQIFIICFQAIHIDNLIDGEDGEHIEPEVTFRRPSEIQCDFL